MPFPSEPSIRLSIDWSGRISFTPGEESRRPNAAVVASVFSISPLGDDVRWSDPSLVLVSLCRTPLSSEEVIDNWHVSRASNGIYRYIAVSATGAFCMVVNIDTGPSATTGTRRASTSASGVVVSSTSKINIGANAWIRSRGSDTSGIRAPNENKECDVLRVFNNFTFPAQPDGITGALDVYADGDLRSMTARSSTQCVLRDPRHHAALTG